MKDVLRVKQRQDNAGVEDYRPLVPQRLEISDRGQAGAEPISASSGSSTGVSTSRPCSSTVTRSSSPGLMLGGVRQRAASPGSSERPGVTHDDPLHQSALHYATYLINCGNAATHTLIQLLQLNQLVQLEVGHD